MKTTILVPVQDLFGEYDQEMQHTVSSKFGMGIPTHIQLNLSEALINKMHYVQELITQHKLSIIQFNSHLTNLFEPPSDVILLKNNDIIPVSSFTEYEKTWQTFDSKSFNLSCHRVYSNKFQAHFFYKNGWTNFSFITEYFTV